MCNNSNCSHDPLNDDLDDLFGGATTNADDAAAFAKAAFSRVTHDPVRKATFEEKCPQCRGTGRFVSYTGRVLGNCFKCKGTGVLKFKSSAETRAKQQAKRDEQRRQRDEQRANDRNAWFEEHSAEHSWMLAKCDRFDFAASMLDAVNQYGSLTERQLAAVRNCMAKDEARKVEAQQRTDNAPTVDATKIEDAFATAQGNGVKRPRMVLNGFKISMAPAHGRNAGALYVVRVEDDQYLGKIAGGRFQRVRECDEATEARVVAVVNDPKGEAIAYGQRTGNCCICNRELTNHASIDAGIGPICAEKFGW